MINKNLKESTVEELKKKEQYLTFGAFLCLMFFIGSCQKFTFWSWAALMVCFYLGSQSGEIKKELKSRESTNEEPFNQ